jgi:hypothetical protein
MKRIIIIGGGISGLYLGYRLLDMNHSVTIIEKEKYLGGRMYTEKVEVDGQSFDIEGGAGVIGEDEKPMIDLLEELDIPFSFWDSKTKIVYHQRKNEILDYDYPKLLNQVCRYSSNKLSFLEILDESNLSRKEKIGMIIGTTYGELFSANSRHVCQENDFNEFLLNQSYKYGKPKRWKDLTDRLEEKILKKNGIILKETSVIEISEHHVKTNHTEDSIHSFDLLIVTCPYHFVKKISLTKLLRPWVSFMDDVHEETDYLRVYFEEPLDIESKIATNLAIRRVIPITKQLIMTVYTDGPDARDIYRLEEEEKLSIYIEKELGKLLERKIPRIKKNWSFFWEKGISSWRPSIVSVPEIIEMIRNPVQNIYFCGDTYSNHPGWVHGALESCNMFLENFNK